jgi:hypothetical protein
MLAPVSVKSAHARPRDARRQGARALNLAAAARRTFTRVRTFQ